MTDEIKWPQRPDANYPPFEDAYKEAWAMQGSPKCMNCGKTGFYYPADHAYVEGHCYTLAGATEFASISQCCEFCFDKMFKEREEDEVEASALIDPEVEQLQDFDVVYSFDIPSFLSPEARLKYIEYMLEAQELEADLPKEGKTWELPDDL